MQQASGEQQTTAGEESKGLNHNDSFAHESNINFLTNDASVDHFLCPDPALTEPEPNGAGGETQEDMELQLDAVLGHIDNILVSPPRHPVVPDIVHLAARDMTEITNVVHTNLDQATLPTEQPHHPQDQGGSESQPHSAKPLQIDDFLNSISRPVPQPLLPLELQQLEPSQYNDTTQSTNKRQSIRLAQKAASNSGKGTIEIAQDL